MFRILIVEDDEPFADALASALRLEGYRVIVAQTAEEGVELGLEHRPDVVIADWVLGGDMHGGEVCSLIQAASPSTKTLLMTGYLHDDLEIRNWPQYAEVLMEKPFHKNAILDAVNRALAVDGESVEVS